MLWTVFLVVTRCRLGSGGGAEGNLVRVWIGGKKTVILDCFEALDGIVGEIGRFSELCDDEEQVLERKGSNRRGDGGFVKKGELSLLGVQVSD